MDRDALNQLPHIMGKSPKMVRLFNEMKKIAVRDRHVLISGESGTYKELAARVIHDGSRRNKGPFIAISFAAIPKELVEAELFGSVKGESSAAYERKTGRIAESNGGTLLLDEISEIDLSLQIRILNFVNDRYSGKLSQRDDLQPGVRIITTTCKNLKELVRKGQFNKDLFQAFNSAHIRIPSLRERKEDVLPLAKDFLKEAVEKFETGPKDLSKEAADFLVRYDWPGNLRELENTIKRVVILSNGRTIEKRDLLMTDVGSCSIKEFLEEKLKRFLKEMTKLDHCNLYATVLSEVERSLIAIVLKETEGNQLKTAKILGINRNTLRTKIKEYKIRV